MEEKRAHIAPEFKGTGQSVPEEEWYDLLPVEKKLITYSLVLGVILLVVFVFAFGIIG
jgi:hypothetical protein